jgi:hypothetical protein
MNYELEGTRKEAGHGFIRNKPGIFLVDLRKTRKPQSP